MKYFELYELVDKKTYDDMGDKCFSLFNPLLLETLDNVREFLNVPITVNTWHRGGRFQWRGYRTPRKADELGSPYSAHAFMKMNGFYIPVCNAVDFDANGMTAWEVRDKIIANKDNPLLQHITRLEDEVPWVHLDLKELSKGKERIYLFRA